MVWEIRKERTRRDQGTIDWVVLRNRLAHLNANNKRAMGLDITFVTSAETDDEARDFLKLMGMPFRRIEAVAAPTKTTAA